jgi:orsellinic acid C2-O-methyltransferase
MYAIERLDWLTRAYRVGQIIRAAALLGVCDVVAAKPMTAEEVAERVGAAVDPMRRLLRTLVALDVLDESDGLFSNAEMGQALVQDHPQAMREVAISRMRDPWWRAWGALPEAVRTGDSAYVLANGRSMWEDLRDDPDAAGSFNAMITSGAEEYAASLLKSLDFTDVGQFIDVGGGRGGILAALLTAAPEVHGTLFDLPAGLIGAREHLAGIGIVDRVDLVPGDFFESVPGGGDVYLLRRVLHNWADEQAVAIVASCRKAIGGRPARLLIADMIMPDRPVPGPAEDETVFTLDLHMLVMLGARERSVSEFRVLLQAAGFRIDDVLTTSPEGTIVASPL